MTALAVEFVYQICLRNCETLMLPYHPFGATHTSSDVMYSPVEPDPFARSSRLDCDVLPLPTW